MNLLHKNILVGMLAVACCAPAMGGKNSQELLDQAIAFENAGEYEKAVLLYEEAGDLGNADALNNLGIYYLQGVGVTENYKKAVELFEAAYKKGSVDAAKSLGFVYRTGRGVPVDLDQALKYYQVAADKGDAFSQNEMGVIYQAEGTEESYAKAAKYYRLAADQNNEMALYNLACLYKEGKGIKADLNEYANLLMKAAKMGFAYAQHDLAAAYGAGDGVEKNMVEMYAWFTVASHAMDVSLEYRDMLGSIMTEDEKIKGKNLGDEYFAKYGSHEN